MVCPPSRRGFHANPAGIEPSCLPSARGFLTPLPALSVLLSVVLSPPPPVLLGSVLSSSPFETQVIGEKHIWIVLQLCSTPMFATAMGLCRPGQCGTISLLLILTPPEVFQCHSSGISLIQQNNDALGVKHLFWL